MNLKRTADRTVNREPITRQTVVRNTSRTQYVDVPAAVHTTQPVVTKYHHTETVNKVQNAVVKKYNVRHPVPVPVPVIKRRVIKRYIPVPVKGTGSGRGMTIRNIHHINIIRAASSSDETSSESHSHTHAHGRRRRATRVASSESVEETRVWAGKGRVAGWIHGNSNIYRRVKKSQGNAQTLSLNMRGSGLPSQGIASQGMWTAGASSQGKALKWSNEGELKSENGWVLEGNFA